LDEQGREVDHVDLHSLRRTFTTDALSNGADPNSVRLILGHKNLDMTMKIYGKMHAQSKRQAIARLSYGKGSQTPEHLVQLPNTRPIRVQFGE
jgi:integrase